MDCPFCLKPLTSVVNSRPTKQRGQIWRRRKCLYCNQTFTTHEIIDLSHIVVIKRSGRAEMFSRMKLYSGIYNSTLSSSKYSKEKLVDKITAEVEREIMHLKQKRIESSIIGDLVLKKLSKVNTASFLRFLAYCKNIQSEGQMKKEIAKYT